MVSPKPIVVVDVVDDVDWFVLCVSILRALEPPFNTAPANGNIIIICHDDGDPTTTTTATWSRPCALHRAPTRDRDGVGRCWRVVKGNRL